MTSQSEGLKHLNNNTAQPSSPQEKEAFGFITSPKLYLKDMSVELADNSYATYRKDFTMVSSVRESSKNLFTKSVRLLFFWEKNSVKGGRPGGGYPPNP